MNSLLLTPDGSSFSHVTCWVFDLDNTLYPSDCNLFDQIDVRMRDFISGYFDIDNEQARHLQKTYFHKHGTTLNGLMREHNVTPDDFLDYVHDIDVSPVAPNPQLAQAISMLPGQKFIFTNGSHAHAEKVAGRLGVLDMFDAIYDIQEANYLPKPDPQTYQRLLQRHKIDARKAAMFEDISRNLVEPHALGMVTVLVHSQKKWGTEPGGANSIFHSENEDHVHHRADDLTSFLNDMIKTLDIETLG